MFVALCAYAGAGFAGRMTPDHFAAEVSNITYQNNDEYLVEITITNSSNETVVLEGYEASFSVQSEILGQWIELSHRAVGVPGHPAGLAALSGKKWKTTETVIIPFAGPHLFRNHEGDMNLLFRYKLKLTGTSSSREGEDGGESAYWVTPQTDRWVLREGM